MPIFCVKSVKIYTDQKKFTRMLSVASVTNIRYENMGGKFWKLFRLSIFLGAFLFWKCNRYMHCSGLDPKNTNPGMIYQNKIIWSHFIGGAISLIKTKAAASTDHRLSDRISFCQMLTSTGAVSWFLAINAV